MTQWTGWRLSLIHNLDVYKRQPFRNETAPPSDEFNKLQAGDFKDWRLAVDGMVARPGVYSISELKSLPVRRCV